MRPAAYDKPQLPGVYFEQQRRQGGAGLEIAETHIVGFLGLAERGPVGVPVRIDSFDEFVAVYGSPSFGSNLPGVVHAFFRNGGAACYVVRVARRARPSSGEGGDATRRTGRAASGTLPGFSGNGPLPHGANGVHAAAEGGGEGTSVQVTAADDPRACCAAGSTLLDSLGKPVLQLMASSEGAWGNDVWVALERKTAATALLTRDLEVGVGAASVATARGFEVGQLVRIYDREQQDYVVITEVRERELRWSAETPVHRSYRANAPTQLEVVEYDLEIRHRDERELFRHLQLSPQSRLYMPKVIATRSRLVTVHDVPIHAPVPPHVPAPRASHRLTGGRDGEGLLAEDFLGWDHGPGDHAGLLALARVEEVALLAAPDVVRLYEQDPTANGEIVLGHVLEQMVVMCERGRDKFALLDVPQTKDLELMRRLRRRCESSFAAYYAPWVLYGGDAVAARWLPGASLMAGVFAGVERSQGVHHAPANVGLAGGLDLSIHLTEEHMTQLIAEGVNVFRAQRGGVRPWGARTACSDPEWLQISARRIFIMVRRALETGFAWVPFETHNHATWQRIEQHATQFLSGVFQKGMLAGKTAEEAFFVRCNAETNPPEAQRVGILTCEIGIAPIAPTEFIMVTLVQEMATA